MYLVIFLVLISNYLFLCFIFCQFGLQGQQGFYLVGRDLSGFLKQNFQRLIGEGTTATPQEVEVVMGRTLHVCGKFYIADTYREQITIIIKL